MPNDLYGVMFRTAAELCGTVVLLVSSAYGLFVLTIRACYVVASAFCEAWKEAQRLHHAFREAWQEAKGES